MDQQNDNNSLCRDIQEQERRIEELERHIEDRDVELRQYRMRESKLETQRDQATRELSDYIKARAQEDRDRLQQIDETCRKEIQQLRDAQARETAMHHKLSKALSQVQEKEYELARSREREEQANKQNLSAQEQKDEAYKKGCEVDQKLSKMQDELEEALRQAEALRKERNKALKQRDEALKKLQYSPMVNFLVQCHKSLFSKLASEPDSLMGSKPSTTKMENRYKPEKLHFFSGFLEKQKAIFKKLCEVFPDDLQAFPRLITVIENGELIEPISSEKALEMFMFAYIQGPGRQILSKLRTADKGSTVCDIFGDMKVIYYPRNLDDRIDAVKKLPVSTETSPAGIPEAATPSTEPQESVLGPAPPKDKIKVWDDTFRPDGLYVCTKPGVGSGRNVVLFPYEVKLKDGQPPVKGMTLMNGGLMQAYDYMAKSLSSFGMLTTGESIVFLYIDWSSDAKTLYYHVAIPAEDIKRAPDNLEETAFYSAVGQFVTFALMAMEHCRDFDQQQRAKVRSKLKKGNLLPPTSKRTASKRKRQGGDSEEV
ncbi:uncharacterized protein CPUR_02868 [Claviceps purpurea 20.1]|uniref:Uncharacterized protein n=1 Tax=Claviceps purpurea (strain 20.1) TaxID=1111077 RepID=M1VVA4_CLAP2|nr:uncharacterized protein CPUR_02868 [Claviceps purpurea 20.1]